MTLDQLDNVSFPRSGYIAQADITASRTAIGAEQNHTKWVIDALGAYSIGDNTFQVAGRFGGAIGSNRIPSYDQFRWGGMLQQSGFRTGALAGQTIGFGRVAYYNKLVKQTLLEGLYAGASLEAGRVGDPLIPGGPTGLQKSGSVFLAYDSPLGPLYLAYGHGGGRLQERLPLPREAVALRLRGLTIMSQEYAIALAGGASGVLGRCPWEVSS